jgi:hypothetical protein
MLNNIIDFNSVQSLNSSKLLAGISIIMLNLGSRYLILDLSEGAQQILKLSIVRRITLFCIFFLGTRDIKISFILTAAFIILSGGLFNEKSKLCILSDNVITKLEKSQNVTDAQYNEAHIILKKYKTQQNNVLVYKNDKLLINDYNL